MELIAWVESNVFWAVVIWYFVGSIGSLFFWRLMFKGITRADLIVFFIIGGITGLAAFFAVFCWWISDFVYDASSADYWDKKVF